MFVAFHTYIWRKNKREKGKKKKEKETGNVSSNAKGSISRSRTRARYAREIIGLVISLIDVFSQIVFLSHSRA